MRAFLVVAVVLGLGPLRSAEAQKPTIKDPGQAIIEALHPPLKKTRPPKHLRLLTKYEHASSIDFEGNIDGEIRKPGGPTFEYHASGLGHMPQYVPKKEQYQSYSDAIINGHRTWRGFYSGWYELTIDMCRVPEYSWLVSFRADVKDPSDARDMVTMALTLLEPDNPRKNGCIGLD